MSREVEMAMEVMGLIQTQHILSLGTVELTSGWS